MENTPTQATKTGGRWTAGRLLAYVGASVGALVLVVALLIQLFGAGIVDGYCKRRAERAFAQAHAGSSLRIGDMFYSFRANRLVAQSVTLSASNTTLKVGRISLLGVRWASLVWGTPSLADVLAKASFDAADFSLQFPQARYEIRCPRLRGSVLDSELMADDTELRASVPDAEFFAAHDFRTTRFHVVLPECRVLGLAYGELLKGQSYRARSVYFSQPSFDALVNRDKPLGPFGKPPLMVSEALAAIRQPLQIDSLSITNGRMRYCEQLVAGADPGVLTISEVNLSAEGIANRGKAPAAIVLRGEGNLMETGRLKVLMSIPTTPSEFSLHYSGSLGAMDLTRLSAFLDVAELTRIKSGVAQEATFEIDVAGGKARGHVRGIYKDLDLALLDKQTGSERRVDHRVASFLANKLKIRNSNAPDASGSMKEGKVEYTRRSEDEFQQFAWFALRTGVLDLITR